MVPALILRLTPKLCFAVAIQPTQKNLLFAITQICEMMQIGTEKHYKTGPDSSHIIVARDDVRKMSQLKWWRHSCLMASTAWQGKWKWRMVISEGRHVCVCVYCSCVRVCTVHVCIHGSYDGWWMINNYIWHETKVAVDNDTTWYNFFRYRYRDKLATMAMLVLYNTCNSSSAFNPRLSRALLKPH